MVSFFLLLSGYNVDKLLVSFLVFLEVFLVVTRLLSYFFDENTKFGKVLRKIMKGLDDVKKDVDSITSEKEPPSSDE